tara:strand:+ start:97 stop:318 length:222 start_codon:yes stop_codon:yes gene_type:complete
MIEVMNTSKFSIMIENFVKEKRCTYMDAVVLYCEENEMEIESAAKLLNTKIKGHLEVEAMELNFIPKVNTLPV